MDKVKILVVEDEIIIADSICETLRELGYDAFEPAISYTEAIEVIENEIPDIAILDIELSGNKTGIDLANTIKKEYKFPFIFLTSNADVITLNKAKTVMPSAYLVKPFSKNELYTSIEIALYNFSQKIGQLNSDNLIIKEALFIKEKGVFYKLAFKDILYIKSAHIYVEIILKDKKKYVVRGSLNDILEKLNYSFIRSHRSYIVNTTYLDQVSYTSLKLYDITIPIGKKYRQDILARVNVL
ncbi:response regulator [Pontimicrobium sp. SW4]|uniref:Response regulator n=1 Tax=Pontimicrobium sp. SW4 TaxID=3153519 RepID=A0AAU7BUS5_9FLAO